jgi:hypothetical protein
VCRWPRTTFRFCNCTIRTPCHSACPPSTPLHQEQTPAFLRVRIGLTRTRGRPNWVGAKDRFHFAAAIPVMNFPLGKITVGASPILAQPLGGPMPCHDPSVGSYTNPAVESTTTSKLYSPPSIMILPSSSIADPKHIGAYESPAVPNGPAHERSRATKPASRPSNLKLGGPKRDKCACIFCVWAPSGVPTPIMPAKPRHSVPRT